MSGRDTSFYYSFLVLPPARRQAIVAVWDFCRAVDDTVDEAPMGSAEMRGQAKARLAEWRRELQTCFSGGACQSAQGQRLQPFVRQFALPVQPFADVIDGVEMDLEHLRYDTFDDLREYCLRVASAVGLVCVAIFGCPDPVARDYAVNLGIALQLTNIIRDVPVDLARGRLYLPLEDLERFGVSEQALREGRLTGQVRGLLRFECERARDFYDRAERSRPAGFRRRLVAADIMGAIYQAMLARIEARGYDVFSEIVRVPRPARAAIAAATWIRTMVRG